MKKLFKILICILMAVLYCGFIGYLVSGLPMNSDSATMLLYADDILSGNIFLSGWHLTGVTFITTDLPFYIISVALLGVSLNAFRLTVFLMYIFMAGSAIALSLYGIQNKRIAIAICGGIGLFPTTYALSNAFVHTAVFALMFLSLLFILIYNNTGSKSALAGLITVSALACAGDGLSLMIIFVPVIVMSLFNVFEKNKIISFAVTSGTVIGILIQKLYISIGGAELNSISHSTFLPVSGLYKSFINYMECLLRLINSYFFSKPMFSLKTAIFAIKICIALFSFYIVYSAVKSVFQRKETDIVIAATGIGFATISLVLLFTTLNANVTGGRYFAYLPLLLGISVARCTDLFPALIKKRTGLLVILLCIPLAGANIISSITDINSENTYSELASFIESCNLENGYATFWDSSVVTGYSENRVKLRPIICDESGIHSHKWFSSKKWYLEDANFIVVRYDGAKDDEFRHNMNGIFNMRFDCSYLYGSFDEQLNGITRNSIIKHLGKPSKEIKFKNYGILVYNKINLE